MLGFKMRKMEEFYQKHKIFLNWYLTRYCNIPQKLHYLVAYHLAECLYQDFKKIKRMSDSEQRKWIVQRIREFEENEK